MALNTEQQAYSGYKGPFTPLEMVDLIEESSVARMPVETCLRENRIARVALGIGQRGFEDLSAKFDECIAETDEVLAATYHLVDSRRGHTAGYFRKERALNESLVQVVDPKNVFQFNEQARLRWVKQFALAPIAIRSFLEIGYEVHSALADAAKEAIQQLDIDRPGLLREHFPTDNTPVSFMRVVRYDSYDNTPENGSLPVAKAHVDICSYTIQGWSSAPGFWGRAGSVKTYHDDQTGDGFFFASRTHEKIFGKESSIKPLIHGVDRIMPPPELSKVPERTAVVLFVNPWRIDSQVTAAETKIY